MIVAIDGPAASGKGTVARHVAKHFNFAHLDTGLLFRAVAFRLLQECDGELDTAAAVRFAEELDAAQLDEPERLRQPGIGALASHVATLPRVRDAIKDFERRFGDNPPGGAAGAVLDGRDIGSVIFPDADVKLFVTASPAVRAQRRADELRARGHDVDAPAIAAELHARDVRDIEREIAPLQQAGGTHLLDTTELSIMEAVTKAVAIIEQHMASG